MKKQAIQVVGGVSPLVVVALVLLLVLAGCGREVTTPLPAAGDVASSLAATAPPVVTALPEATPMPAESASSAETQFLPATLTPETGIEGLSVDQVATLRSLEKVDDYPLYTMHYFGSYDRQRTSLVDPKPHSAALAWGCSLFAALGNGANLVYGRNFDWQYSPALLLFTDPPGGYASAAMVDIAYLGFDGDVAGALTELSLQDKLALLETPYWPFDGMNEQGVVVGMAAVPPGEMQPDPDKETVGSLGVIRAILDHAADVDEAVSIMESVNIDMGGGPPIHYLIADRSGRAMLVEFYQGEMVVIPNTADWHLATNFLRSAVDGPAGDQCWRYDTIDERLAETSGRLSNPGAMDLLSRVSQPNTQWSVVYGIHSGEVTVALDRRYETVHTFSLVSADR